MGVDPVWALVAGVFSAVCVYGAKTRPRGHRISTYAAMAYGLAVASHALASTVAARTIAITIGALAVVVLALAFRAQYRRRINYHLASLERQLDAREERRL